MVCKFIETNSSKTIDEIKNNSINWGNYRNAVFDITKGKYSSDKGQTFNEVVKKYTKGEYATGSGILLTTGATKRNSVLNIYDFAGNLSEYVLSMESSSSDSLIRFALRGSSYSQDGATWTAGGKFGSTTGNNLSLDYVGFRITLIPTSDI